ncbi:MAG: hypothetical protein AAF512_13045, partial [Pseudomonadota bacterium]
VLSPEHAKIVAKTGWDRRQVREYLFEHAYQTVEDMKRVGKYSGREHNAQQRENIHRGLEPDDILVLVGGGDAGGHSAFIPSWSRSRGSLMQSKSIGNR